MQLPWLGDVDALIISFSPCGLLFLRHSKCVLCSSTLLGGRVNGTGSICAKGDNLGMCVKLGFSENWESII